MSEIRENRELPANARDPACSDREPDEPRNFQSSTGIDRFGDWNELADAWYIKSRDALPDETAIFEAENSVEWKCRNPYSMSSPNGDSVYCISRHAVTSTPANLRSKSDEMTKEKESYLDVVREHLARYQEAYGTPRGEYSFAALIRLMGQATGRSLLALFYIVVNITPMAQIFLYVLRFVLDKMISIRRTSDCQQAIVKYAILGVQLLCIYVCLVFIFGFIVLPILKMVTAIFAKIMLYD